MFKRIRNHWKKILMVTTILSLIILCFGIYFRVSFSDNIKFDTWEKEYPVYSFELTKISPEECSKIFEKIFDEKPEDTFRGSSYSEARTYSKSVSCNYDGQMTVYYKDNCITKPLLANDKEIKNYFSKKLKLFNIDYSSLRTQHKGNISDGRSYAYMYRYVDGLIVGGNSFTYSLNKKNELLSWRIYYYHLTETRSYPIIPVEEALNKFRFSKNWRDYIGSYSYPRMYKCGEITEVKLIYREQYDKSNKLISVPTYRFKIELYFPVIDPIKGDVKFEWFEIPAISKDKFNTDNH